ncbi:DEAD/DEAH box helicase family protein [Methylobacterium sp. D53M]
MSLLRPGSGQGLRELPTPLLLQTSTDQIIESFYEPALGVAASYDRGVGYFTSGWLRMVSRGLSAFAAGGGMARFLVSPNLSPTDWELIRAGTEARRDSALRGALERELRALVAAGLDADVASLGLMVADGVLDFRLALPADGLEGDFHDKFGVFRDRRDDAIAFHGSQNDSAKAFANFEAISLFYSWMSPSDAKRVAIHSQRFERLWAGQMPHVRVLALPEAVREGLEALAPARAPVRAGPRQVPPPSDVRWRHQDEAVEAFMESGAGVLEMATGTGKTRTALRILGELARDGRILSAIVTMSGTDLLDQWYAELCKVAGFVVHRSYGDCHEALSFLNDPSGAILLASRQTLGAVMLRLPASVAAETLLICDEVHGMGSPTLVAGLSGRLRACRYRLGLSATPEREYDQDGTDFIEHEIGPVVFRFGLEDAIGRGILCEFDYVPLHYDFSDKDKAAVRRAISSYHAKVRAGQAPGKETMYRDIAQVAKSSPTKLPVFADFLRTHPKILHRAILFVDNARYGMAVQEIILPIAPRYHTYYAEDDRSNLIRFARGELDALITCHRISEGIDIQSVNSVVLFASSRSRLETVQRLGRCLRKDVSNPAKRATVVDFIRNDDIDVAGGGPPTADQARRDWLQALSMTRARQSDPAIP